MSHLIEVVVAQTVAKIQVLGVSSWHSSSRSGRRVKPYIHGVSREVCYSEHNSSAFFWAFLLLYYNPEETEESTEARRRTGPPGTHRTSHVVRWWWWLIFWRVSLSCCDTPRSATPCCGASSLCPSVQACPPPPPPTEEYWAPTTYYEGTDSRSVVVQLRCTKKTTLSLYSPSSDFREAGGGGGHNKTAKLKWLCWCWSRIYPACVSMCRVPLQAGRQDARLSISSFYAEVSSPKLPQNKSTVCKVT